VVGEIAAEGRTVVAITHDMDFCAENFDRVLVMAGGRVIADGTPEQAFARLDALAEAHVEPPQLERLRTALGWPVPVSTVDEFVAQLKSRR
ncbi:MAG: heme ABC transporter ATP-binding protein, partial [Pseudolysinimonas sp.]